MQRRRWLQLTLGTGAVVATGAGAGALWLSGEPAPIATFPTFDAVSAWLDALDQASAPRSITSWSLPQVIEHAAQSIEYSLSGYPRLHSDLFRASVGSLAYLAFARRGRMSHATTEAIPGAPALVETSLDRAILRLRRALDAFEAAPTDRALAPHFAYGRLDKAAYRRAHLMHLADHAREIRLA